MLSYVTIILAAWARRSSSPSALAALRSRAESNPICFEIRWEYSSENTRFEIDPPKQLDA
jgi:hypothetical protein